MLPENIKAFLVEYRWLVQVAASAGIALLFGWLASRAQPQTRAGWRYSYYPLAVKAIAVLGAAFMTAAVAYNGTKLFASDWWVAPAIILLTIGAYWLLYEIFVTRLRWNDECFELVRYPFAVISLPFSEIAAIKHHPITESLTVIATNGERAWFPYSYRAGMSELFSRLNSDTNATES